MSDVTTIKRKNNVCGRHASRHAAVLACALTVVMTSVGRPAELRPADFSKGWRFSGDRAADIPRAFDRDLETAWSSGTPQREGAGVTLDFGEPVAVHRMILDPGDGERRFHFPRSIRVAAGMEPDALKVFLERRHDVVQEGNPVLDLKFNAVAGRYLRIEIGAAGAGFPWSVAELTLYGFRGEGNLTAVDAVIIPDGIPELPKAAQSYVTHSQRGLLFNIPDDIGARDLSYYLGEISGRPVPVIAAEDQAGYPGRLFVIEAPQPPPSYEDAILQRERQSVHVFQNGREIRFAGHTWAGVFYSVVEFLDRQGVRWLFPSVYGDHIARRNGVDLDVLPLRYTPPMELRWFGGNPVFEGLDFWLPYHRWNHFFGGRGTAYSGMGHHTFAGLIPAELYQEHPAFFPMLTDARWNAHLAKHGHALGDRLPYTAWPSGGKTFCTSSPEARAYIVAKTVERAKAQPEYHVLSIGEMDAVWTWCECPRCRAQDRDAAAEFDGGMSERLADLVVDLAERLKTALPERTLQIAVMAYNQTTLPPQSVKRFPDNVSVNVVICSGETGYRIFHPPTAVPNAKAAQILSDWAKRTRYLGIYNWDLLKIGEHGMPIVMIRAASEWFKTWKQLGVCSIQPEVSLIPIIKYRYNPWAPYIYSRLSWNPDEPAAQLIDDFFTGYFREAAAPMRAYYETLETHVHANNLLYGQHQYILQANPAMFTSEILAAMHGHLGRAEAAAVDFITRRRVAYMREGFEKVLQAVGLQKGDFAPNAARRKEP